MSARHDLVVKVAGAWIALEPELRLKNCPFKIGRTVADEGTKAKLVSRYQAEYPGETILDARAILHDTDAAVAAAEKALIRRAWDWFPDRCINEQEGGGGSGDAKQHCVYVVLLKKSDALVNAAWEGAFARLMAE